MQESVADIIEALGKCDKLASGHLVLANALAKHGFNHVAYAAINVPCREKTELVAVTYTPEWRKQYLQKNYANLDPVVKAGMGGILPFLWNSLPRDEPLVRKFIGEAKEFNIGEHGLSIPIRGRHREFGMLSVSTSEHELVASKLLNEQQGNCMLLAYHFHEWALKQEGMNTDSYWDLLSTREKECLRWQSAGKSAWEVGEILSISERTVTFHLTSAKAKLGTSTITHAVAKAVRLGLISFD